MGFIGQLINSAVRGTGGALRGANEGEKERYDRQRHETEDALRRFVAERQAREDESQRTARERTAKHYDYEEQPEWKKRGYPNLEAYDRARDHTDDRPTWQKEGYPSFAAWRHDRTTSRTGSDEEKIADLNAVIDDSDREVGRAEREQPAPWADLPEDVRAVRDSATYVNSEEASRKTLDALRGRRDRFAHTRDSLVAHRHGMDRPSAGGPAERLLTGGGPPPDRPVGHAASRKPIPGTEVTNVPAEAPVASDVTAGDVTLQLQDLERQKAEAIAWRGPNGERKDPQAIERRYQEARAQLAGGQ